MEDFQSHYDAVITGTGLTQAIVAAAMARVGKSVFHCDQNHYYSQEWQSMNFTQVVNWCHLMNESSNNPSTTDPNPQLLQESESYRKCFRKDFISNVSQISYLCDTESDDITSSSVNEPINQQLGDAEQQVDGEPEPAEEAGDAPPPAPLVPTEDKPKKWSLFKFNLESRKFNLDLTPRVIKTQFTL